MSYVDTYNTSPPLHVCKGIMSSSPLDFGQLVQTTTEAKYSSLAAATFFFWDYCITFADEVELIWKGQWSFISFLFFEVRYLNLVLVIMQLLFHTSLATHILLTAAGCAVWIWFKTIIGYSVFLGVELLLVMRLYALYGRPKGLLIALYILFFAINGAAFVFMVILLSQWVLKPIPSSVPSNLRNIPCFTVKIPKVFPYYWALGLAYDSILFFLLIGMWIHKYFTTGMGGGGLLQVLVRDGAWAFFIVFALLLWFAIQFSIDSICGGGIMGELWLHTCLGVVGPRLVLNLRDFDRKRRSLMSEECELHTINHHLTFYASSRSHTSTQEEQSTSSEGIKKVATY
ncbi:hypothetical protein BU17DRAFT_79759 [Hysterangium stoloniferum]|nr:hypothetical protein BU17DRAFT_79759 [Hysterangium stoloniferum]